jgi:hypothetical protein
VHLVNPVSPLIGDGSEGKVGGVAIQNVVGLGCEWAEVGSRSLVDETLGASHQPYKSKKKKNGAGERFARPLALGFMLYTARTVLT